VALRAHRGFAQGRAVTVAARPVVGIEPSASAATRLPPFGRDVQAAVAAGGKPNVYLFATRDAWESARRRRDRHGAASAMLLPPGETAHSYRWPLIPGGVFIVANGMPRKVAFELARAVVSYGTPLAVATFGNDELLIMEQQRAKAAG